MLRALRPADWRMLNQVVHLILVWVVKGRDTNNHLVDQDSKRPPVQCFVVSRPDDHLRGQVLWRTAEGVGLLTILLHDLGQAKVSQHDVTIVVQQNVLRLEITVDDVALVEVAKG